MVSEGKPLPSCPAGASMRLGLSRTTKPAGGLMPIVFCVAAGIEGMGNTVIKNKS